MFKKNKKLELSNDELRIIRYSLVDFRNDLIKENKYGDAVADVLIKLKNKVKVDKYDLGAIVNGLCNSRKKMIAENQDTSAIDELILKLMDIHETLKKY